MSTSHHTSRDLADQHYFAGARPCGRRVGQTFVLTLSLLAAGACRPAVGQSTSALDQTVLGNAQSFAVLGGSTVTSTGSTSVFGDLGVDPGLAVTGFPPGLVSNGTIQAGTAVTLQAQNDTTTAYIALAAQSPTLDLTGQDLGGQTLVPGVYHFASSAQLTGALTLDALGDPAAVFVFQIGSTLTTASNSSVLVINGAQDCNIFWQVGSSATLGTTTEFKGNILALTSITLVTGAQISGRALARNGAVTLDTNSVSTLACTAAVGNDAGAGGHDANGGSDASVGDAGVPPPDSAASVCGNGILEAGEECDDGNLDNSDSCDTTCHLVYCCGNGILEPGEQCDDNNNLPGDGCSATCTIEI
jgi:cysteine-rich repeat protein